MKIKKKIINKQGKCMKFKRKIDHITQFTRIQYSSKLLSY